MAGARKSLLRKIVVVKEFVDGGLKRIIVVVNIMLEIPQEQAEGVRKVLIHLVQTSIHNLMDVQVVTQSTVNNSWIRNQGKAHLKRVLQSLQHRRRREAHLPGCRERVPQGTD